MTNVFYEHNLAALIKDHHSSDFDEWKQQNKYIYELTGRVERYYACIFKKSNYLHISDCDIHKALKYYNSNYTFEKQYWEGIYIFLSESTRGVKHHNGSGTIELILFDNKMNHKERQDWYDDYFSNYKGDAPEYIDIDIYMNKVRSFESFKELKSTSSRTSDVFEIVGIP